MSLQHTPPGKKPRKDDTSDPMNAVKKEVETRTKRGFNLSDIGDLIIHLGDAMKTMIKESEIKHDKVLESTEKSICDTLAGFAAKFSEIAELQQKLEKENHELRDLTAKLQDRILALEMFNIRGNLIVKNLPVCDYAEKEKRLDTPEEAQDVFFYSVLQPTGLGDTITNFSAWRLPVRNGPPLLKVVLAFPHQKQILFRSIAHPNSKLAKGIHIQNEFPLALRGLMKAAEKQAYDIRQSTHGATKTRISMRQNTVKLLIKEESDKSYKEIKIKDN